MRGRVDSQGDVYHTFNLNELIPATHPLRPIKRRADQVLAGMSRDFNAAYGATGRPGVPPERLLKALLLQGLYSIRSEIQLCEQIGYNLLFRWFLDLRPSERVCAGSLQHESAALRRARLCADVLRPRQPAGHSRRPWPGARSSRSMAR